MGELYKFMDLADREKNKVISIKNIFWTGPGKFSGSYS
jgi:hypothetical protein